jgi:hypothetical protein
LRWQKLVGEAVYGSVVGIAKADRISKRRTAPARSI